MATTDISGNTIDVSGVTVKELPTVDFSKLIAEIVTDLSGASAADLLRYVPRFAAHIHALDLPKADKRVLVLGALRELADRCIPADAHEAARSLLDTVAPAALAGVIDVVRGRVSFAPELALAPAVVQKSGNCLMALFGCIKK